MTRKNIEIIPLDRDMKLFCIETLILEKGEDETLEETPYIYTNILAREGKIKKVLEKITKERYLDKDFRWRGNRYRSTKTFNDSKGEFYVEILYYNTRIPILEEIHAVALERKGIFKKLFR